MEDPRNRQYTNGEITVFWKPAKCVHATTCFRELIEVYNPGRRPWVDMSAASTQRIIEVTDKCPTDAILWKYNKDLSEDELNARTSASEEVNPETLTADLETKPAKVTIMKDGPIVVEGKFKVIDSNGNELKSMIMTSFCRCGGSHSMPYCDGRHRKIGFKDKK